MYSIYVLSYSILSFCMVLGEMKSLFEKSHDVYIKRECFTNKNDDKFVICVIIICTCIIDQWHRSIFGLIKNHSCYKQKRRLNCKTYVGA